MKTNNNDLFVSNIPILMVFVIAMCVSLIIYLPFLATTF